jgi:ribosomal protein L11 methyltransferase
MEYTELTVNIDPFEQVLSEITAAYLSEIGYESMLETSSGLKAYIPARDFKETILDFNFLPKDTIVDFSFEKIKEENWNKEWESSFKPVIIGKRCIIKAPFHTDLPKAKFEIIIEPKMSFGTGHHETTSLMIEQIYTMNLNGTKVLDMGCGTGVLGILASMKGAAHIDAIDIDEWAYSNSVENADRNGVTNMNIIQGGVESINADDYDVVIANINRNIILEDLPTYTSSLKLGGTLLLSGFYMNDMSKILAKAMDLGYSFNGFKEKNKWVAAAFVKK